MNDQYKICLIAGEASGDALGAKLMASLLVIDSDIEFIGVGGQRMEELGLKTIFPIHELSIIGWIEIIPHIPHLLKRINQTVDEIISQQPDIVITIDAPAFNFRVAKKLQNTGIKLVHYVAPTVWAYKPERAQKIAKLYDHLLLLLPFEKPYFDAVGLANTFIGHPIMEEGLSDGDGAEFRTKHNIPQNTIMLSVLVGSRTNEIKRLLPIFKQAITLLYKKYPDLYVVFITTSRFKERIIQEVADLEISKIFIDAKGDKKHCYAASDICLAKSGTVSFEPAIAHVPFIVAYKVNALSAWILRRMMKTKFVNLINIISQKEVVKELLQEDCTAENIAKELSVLINDKTARQQQITDVKQALNLLETDQPASDIAAKTIYDMMRK